MNEKEYELYLKVAKMTDEEFREAVKKAGACDILEKTSQRKERDQTCI
ncbi:MAG: hypothetical protein MJ059_04500 [Lachnospiraceae bacterium]|nr:hypothetical protein [Lachnospiraceae bacterium]